MRKGPSPLVCCAPEPASRGRPGPRSSAADGVQVALHSRFTDVQLSSDVLVVKSQRDTVSDFQLPFGQAFQGRDRRGGVRQALQGPSGGAAIGPEFPRPTISRTQRVPGGGSARPAGILIQEIRPKLPELARMTWRGARETEKATRTAGEMGPGGRREQKKAGRKIRPAGVVPGIVCGPLLPET